MWNDPNKVMISIHVEEKSLLGRIAKIKSIQEQLNREIAELEKLVTVKGDAPAYQDAEA